MQAQFAKNLVIILSLAVIAFNVYQVSSSYQYVLNQIRIFREALQAEKDDGTSLNWLNWLFYVFFPVVYLYVFYYAGFQWWIIGVLATKFLLGSIFSYRTQRLILSNQPYLPMHFLFAKIDSAINVILFSLVIGALVWW
jgi:hypothetical protein